MSSLNRNKVEYFGQTLVDLTNDTVTSEALLSGFTAHDASGSPITGIAINVQDVLGYMGLIYYNDMVYVKPDQGE